jgi:transposase-like protein
MVIYQSCTTCGSGKIVKNGKTAKTAKRKQNIIVNRAVATARSGQPKCTMKKKRRKFSEAYKEQASLRGVHRIHGVAITTVLSWLKKKPRR